MTVNLSLFLMGLLLLWFPRHWMRRGVAFLRRRRRSADSTRITEPWRDREPGDPRVDFRVEFVKFRNYIDLLRAATGSLMLAGGFGLPAAIGLAAGAPRSAPLQLLGVRFTILLVGLLLQAVRNEKQRITFYPPIFYLAGLSIGLCDIRAAGFAFVLIWSISPALPNAQGFMSLYAFFMVVFGYLFKWSGGLSPLYSGFLCFLPVLLSLLAKRPLTIFARKGTRQH